MLSPLVAIALGATVAAACSSAFPSAGTGGGGGDQGSGTGGSPGAGGAAGMAASGGAGGGSNLRLGMGGPFPFPQNKTPGMCTLTTASNASGSVQAAYTSWKGNYVTSAGAGANLRVTRGGSGNPANDTVSEGIGYGMLAAVYMADRATFDGLWGYAKAHFDTHNLMAWHIDASGTAINDAMGGTGSATDGDEDMAWALIQASDQWSSTTYLTDAKSVIGAMLTTEIAGDGSLKPGDNWGGTDCIFHDYFSPAYYRVFAEVTGNTNWSGAIIDRNYAILAAVAGTDGLVPNQSNATGTACKTPNPNASTYGYDACRTPWRIGMDYCLFGEARAKAYLTKIGSFFNGVGGGAGNITDGYSATGQATSQNHNMAFIGPAGVAGMAGYQSLLDGAFNYGATNNGGDGSYFPQSLRVVTMLMMSGNFVDFTKP
jgi:endo-1,4-beta-D-glucanase Y